MSAPTGYHSIRSLRDLLTSRLGQNAAATVGVEFPTVTADDEAEIVVCRVTFGSSPSPVYLRPGKGAAPELWVGSGNSTRQLTIDEAAQYEMQRWPLGLGSSLAAQFRAAVRFSAG